MQTTSSLNGMKGINGTNGAHVDTPRVKARRERGAEFKAQPKETIVTPHEDDVFTRFTAMQDEVLASLGVISWKRKLCATIAVLVVTIPTGLAIGSLLNTLMAMTLATTGSAFLMWIVWLLGCALSFYLGAWIGRKLSGYILERRIDEDAKAVASFVGARFKALRSKLSRS